MDNLRSVARGVELKPHWLTKKEHKLLGMTHVVFHISTQKTPYDTPKKTSENPGYAPAGVYIVWNNFYAPHPLDD